MAPTLSAAFEALEADIALAKDVPEDVLALGRRAAEITRRAAVPAARRRSAPTCYFLEIRGRGVFLRASPIDVSAIVRDLLLDRMDATVLTSATLTVDGAFDYVKGRLGVGQATELQARLGVRLRAPGDPLPAAAHARPAVSRSSPPPRRARWSRS